jgi:cytidylate kinase
MLSDSELLLTFAETIKHTVMKLDEKYVITINRELGSGGRTIGEKLAKRLGVPFYDKALIQQLEKKYDLTSEEIERLKGQKHNWWADFKRSLKIMPSFAAPQIIPGNTAMPDFLVTNDIFKSETEILKGICADESCVIAGRSGFYVLRDHPNHLSILIQAKMEYRVKRLMGRRGISEEEAVKIIKEVDKARESYVNKYTGTSRYDTRNYDMVFNVENHTEDEIVDLIVHYIKKK